MLIPILSLSIFGSLHSQYNTQSCDIFASYKQNEERYCYLVKVLQKEAICDTFLPLNFCQDLNSHFSWGTGTSTVQYHNYWSFPGISHFYCTAHTYLHTHTPLYHTV